MTSSLKLSGPLGIIIIPDNQTQNNCRVLAKELLDGAAQYYLQEQDLPHLTLFHGKLLDVPAIISSSRKRKTRMMMNDLG